MIQNRKQNCIINLFGKELFRSKSFVGSVHTIKADRPLLSYVYASIYIFKLLTRALKSIAAKPGGNQSRVNRAHERSSSSRPSRATFFPRKMSEYSSYFYERRCYICERSAPSSPKDRYAPQKSTHRVRFTEPSKWKKF